MLHQSIPSGFQLTILAKECVRPPSFSLPCHLPFMQHSFLPQMTMIIMMETTIFTATMTVTMINASEMTNNEAGGTFVALQDCFVDAIKLSFPIKSETSQSA